ncbi:hypothetical protein COCC4DRAFT_51632 [Bipolaris maydis ATCC 48331]|uniref:Rhodopsin domain-containing protein n=2 Tax=Cochliobolus heterostrophus TaxID=5016 RepID=M2VB68_COCH5|nr:uncharacterized protein COCC4DRAFT_51632 [Bipolaris maydis ATCC 48331]EMD96918.1 hypothetical protein COCHEDRAFT_1163123 [Bipolaris maydis C5]KAH7558126.1 hypothetical protein BM1_05398 [Bipolaris maydis]ENI03788.1 hypothetical protein COCC4DRAFT_51632 [Bipolaris maydis ATCC 48331]KAJ5031215.1 hypothetical protein J3E73DRAFT_419474 [Bipolaris maydis]KAJ5033299.1 hypothetical protein J3E74DRAFT_258593 [Bipolaris maydis]
MASNEHGQVVSWYICTIAAVPFVALRMWTRWKRVGRFGIDDFLVVLSLLCLIGDLAIQQHMWNLGLSQIPAIPPENFKGIMQMIIPGSTLYVTSLWAIKFALVFFYKSLAAPGSRLVTVYNVALGGLVVTYLIIFFDILFQCYPHDKRWSNDPTYQCSPRAAEINYWITIFFNIFTDVIIIALPITMVSRLQMKLKQKLGVAAIFALGFLVVIASCIRAYYSKRNETMLTCTVSMIETAIAIIATCLPALRSTLLGTNTTKGSSSGYGGRHYELSSARRKASENRLHSSKINSSHQTSSTGGLQSHTRANGSEDSLFSNESLNAAETGTAGTAVKGIRVNTQIETMFEEGRHDSSSPNVKSPFA